MAYTLLSPHLHSIADAANRTIKKRHNLSSNGKIESSIELSIPFRPTLHWKSKTHFVACEVADRPFPKSIKESFADILASTQPIRLIVAYPQEVNISAKEYQDDIKQCKKFGIGYMSINNNGQGNIESQGISLSLYLPFPSNLSSYKPKIKTLIQEAYEHYLLKCDPDIALQNIGQAVERILYTTAEQAKQSGNFIYNHFTPPNFISQTTLINKLIDEQVLDIGILGRCKDFARDRNSVSHKPKTLNEARKIEKKLRDNFITGTKILEDLPIEIINKNYKIRI